MNKLLIIVIFLFLVGCRQDWADGRLLQVAIDSCELNGGVRNFRTLRNITYVNCKNKAQFILSNYQVNKTD